MPVKPAGKCHFPGGPVGEKHFPGGLFYIKRAHFALHSHEKTGPVFQRDKAPTPVAAGKWSLAAKRWPMAPERWSDCRIVGFKPYRLYNCWRLPEGGLWPPGNMVGGHRNFLGYQVTGNLQLVNVLTREYGNLV